MAGMFEDHTVRRYDAELNRLHLLVLEMAGLVVEQCRCALRALEHADPVLAREVIRREGWVDSLELRLDGDVSWQLGRRAPVARDLRAVMSFAKVVADLERIGDEAARFAHLVLHRLDTPWPRPVSGVPRAVVSVGAQVVAVLGRAVALFDSFDIGNAYAVLGDGDTVESACRGALQDISADATESCGDLAEIVVLLCTLERIAADARRLAEHAIYLIGGEDVRHLDARNARIGRGDSTTDSSGDAGTR